jgi:hypothetical protein
VGPRTALTRAANPDMAGWLGVRRRIASGREALKLKPEALSHPGLHRHRSDPGERRGLR